MTKWNKGNPKYTDTYLTACNIGSMLGGYNEVRTYDFDSRNKKWDIQERYDETVTIIYWADMPDLPKHMEEENNENY